jgi:hypothetical protein
MAIKRFVLRSVGQRLPGPCREHDSASGGTHPVVKAQVIQAFRVCLAFGGNPAEAIRNHRTSKVRLPMRVFRSGFLFVAAMTSLVAGGFLAASDAAPAGASPAGITVNCPTDNLQDAINSAAAGSRLIVGGTCTGNFSINKNLTLSGPAILDGGGVPTQDGVTLNVISGTVVLNNLVIQDGVGINSLGGGLWNSGQLTLNHSTVTHNTANAIGGVFNMGQLTLNSSTVSHNIATNGGGGGIFNCGANPGFQTYGLCTGAPAILNLDSSVVSNNIASSDGGGIENDPQAVTTLNGSIVSGNTAGGNGGGIENHGTTTLDISSVSGNTGSSGGGIMNNGTATLNGSAVSNNYSTGGAEFFGGGGGLSNGLSNTGMTTLNYSLVRDNSAAYVGGGIFAGGGPMKINQSIVAGNSAVTAGGGIIVWDGPTTVTNSAFSNNSDQAADQGLAPDSPAGVWVAPSDYLGFFTNNPTFTTTHSTYN